MRRLLLLAALVAPAGLLLFFLVQPQADLLVEVPLAHFYVVTFTTFSAAVISILLIVALGEAARPRHVLAAAAFAVIGGLFFSHGLTTPGAIIANFHPAIQWSAWLTLFGGGLVFALAALDGPQGAPFPLPVRRIVAAAAAAVLLYSAIAAFFPHWLNRLNQGAGPWHHYAIFAVTLGLWLFAAYRLWRTWRVTRSRVDGALAFTALWLGQATVSMHLFPLNRLSWWLYHFILLGGFLFVTAVLVMQYERARQFRVQRYFLAAALILTALLALVASHLFAAFSYRTLVAELEASSAQLVGSLTNSVALSLSPGASPAEARAKFAQRLAGEAQAMGSLRVYDPDGVMVFPPGQAAPFPPEAGEAAYFRQALRGETLVRIRPPGDAPPGFVPAAPVHLIETYTAIPAGPGGAPVGVLVTLQEAPELSRAILRGRAAGLGIAALTMGLLFAALLLVVRRADHILTQRTEELRSAYTALQEAESTRDDLTHMIVHDLRTPLSVISASLEMLTRAPAGEQADRRDRYVGRAHAAGRRMTGLIDDLLNVAQMEAGELRPQRRRVPVAALLHDSLADFIGQPALDDRRFSYECPEGLCADLDAEQISRVLINLVGNAVKYTSPGGAIRVAAWAEPEAGRVCFSVRDDGQGIPDEYKSRIFDKFVRVPNGEQQPLRKGTGIGLTFCRLAVAGHGGRIWVEDAPGGGSDFRFWIPESGGLRNA